MSDLKFKDAVLSGFKYMISGERFTKRLSEIYDAVLREDYFVRGSEGFTEKFSRLLNHSIRNSISDDLRYLGSLSVRDNIETEDGYNWYSGFLFSIRRKLNPEDILSIILFPWSRQEKSEFMIDRAINAYSNLTLDEIANLLNKTADFMTEEIIDRKEQILVKQPKTIYF